jgi:serine phosphatase RsbU (regulator of sigma subunit)
MPPPDSPNVILVRQVMVSELVMVSPTEPLEAVLRLMAERRIGSVLIGEGAAVAGIFTERDLLRIAPNAPHGWRQRPVADWMTRDPQTISPDTTWEEAVTLMDRLHIRHLPVVKNGRAIGIVSARQLIANRTEHLNRLVDDRTNELQRLTEQLIERDRQMQRNLAAAGRLMQRLVIPSTRPPWPELTWAVHFRPLDPLGGDYYDFAHPDGRHLGMLIADASGHSIPAALVAIMTRLAFTEASRDSFRPSAVLSALNEQLQGLADERYVSAFYGIYDRVLQRFTYANAGHPPPLHFDARTGTCRRLDAAGFLLGIVPNAEYAEQHISLTTGDRLCLYTDGVTESRNAAGTLYGIERLEAAFAATGRGGPEAGIRRLVDALECFRSDRPATDDLTLVVADVRGG